MDPRRRLGFRHVVPDVFAEGFGLVLVSPNVLRNIVPHGTTNLLDAFRATDLGDRACAAGATVPVLGLSLGYYDVAIRSAPPRLVDAVQKTASGWLIRADDAPLVLCGLGYLAAWNPEDSRHQRVRVPDGWYSVAVAGGVRDTGAWAIDLLLEPMHDEPELTADPSHPFDLYLDE